MMETIGVVAHEERHDEPRVTSPSWFIAKLNPVSRFIGAILLCVPMFLSLDVVSASAALLIDLMLLWIGGVNPLTVLRKTWMVWIAAVGSFVSVTLYGTASGATLFTFGLMAVSEGSLYAGAATFLRVAAIAVPGVIFALGLDPTDLADGLVQILHLPSRFVYGGLAGMRMVTLLQDDWRALGLSAVRAGWATEAPSDACSCRPLACWSCRFVAEPSLPPPWRHVDSAATFRAVRRVRRACMGSTGCST